MINHIIVSPYYNTYFKKIPYNNYIPFSNTYSLLRCYEKYKLYLLTYVIIVFQKKHPGFYIFDMKFTNPFIYSNTISNFKLKETYSKVSAIDYYLLYSGDYKLFSMVLSLIYTKNNENVIGITNDIISHLSSKNHILNERQFHLLTKNIVFINILVTRLHELYIDYKDIWQYKIKDKQIIYKCLNFLYVSSQNTFSKNMLRDIYNSLKKYRDVETKSYSGCNIYMYLVFNYNWLLYHNNFNTIIFYDDYAQFYNYLIDEGYFVLVKFKPLTYNTRNNTWYDLSHSYWYSSCNGNTIPENEDIFHFEM